MEQTITIRNEELQVVLSTFGAEPCSVRDRSGVERLWQGAPKVWKEHAPILFPICGAFKEDTYYADGQAYKMQKHGFAKEKQWVAESVGSDRAVFLLKEKTDDFPFDYELRAAYSLRGATLEVEYTVSNRGRTPFFFGIGSHEGYDLPEGKEHYWLEFEQEEDLKTHEVIGSLIRPEATPVAEHTRVLRLKPDYFAVDALVFTDLKSRSVTLRSDLHDRSVRVDFEGMDVLLLWSTPEAGLICIEPWTNAPDMTDTDQQIEHKKGCFRLAPGEDFRRSHRLTFG